MAEQSNSKRYPEAWKFFEGQARNMEGTEEEHLGKYRIPVPNFSGDFIYADDPGKLWARFIVAWYRIDHNSHSLYGKIQFIVNNLNH